MVYLLVKEWEVAAISSAEFVTHDELENANEKIMNYVDLAVARYVRESERRVRAEIKASEDRTQEKINALRERFDIELGQVHAEIGHIQDALMWIMQRLPPEPLGPPPAQFVRHDEEKKA